LALTEQNKKTEQSASDIIVISSWKMKTAIF